MEDALLVCNACGFKPSVSAQGTAPRFCPKCGKPFFAADPATETGSEQMLSDTPEKNDDPPADDGQAVLGLKVVTQLEPQPDSKNRGGQGDHTPPLGRDIGQSGGESALDKAADGREAAGDGDAEPDRKPGDAVARFSDAVSRIELEMQAVHSELIRLRKGSEKHFERASIEPLEKKLKQLEARISMLDGDIHRVVEKFDRKSPLKIGFELSQTDFIKWVMVPLVIILLMQGVIFFALLFK